MTAPELLSRLEGVRSRGAGKWVARCPFHQDNSPSLSIGEGADRILLHCFALCETPDIVAALGLTMADLFFDAPSHHEHRPTPNPARTDYAALAFRFELGALDRRLRAEHVNQAVNAISINELPDNDLDRLVDAVARAYADIERAELLDGVADGLRAKAFAQKERTVSHAAKC
jgi:hypothetical protein